MADGHTTDELIAKARAAAIALATKCGAFITATVGEAVPPVLEAARADVIKAAIDLDSLVPAIGTAVTGDALEAAAEFTACVDKLVGTELPGPVAKALEAGWRGAAAILKAAPKPAKKESEPTGDTPPKGFEDFDSCVLAKMYDGKDETEARKICGDLQLEADTEKRTARLDSIVKSAFARTIEFRKASEQRFVLGLVLEPQDGDTTDDTQGDIYTAEDIEAAQQYWMEESAGKFGEMHKSFVDGKLRLLECYIIRCDAPTTVIGGRVYKSGSWMLAARVLDDDMWEKVKKGGFTGWSFGGVAVRTPLEQAA